MSLDYHYQPVLGSVNGKKPPDDDDDDDDGPVDVDLSIDCWERPEKDWKLNDVNCVKRQTLVNLGVYWDSNPGP